MSSIRNKVAIGAGMTAGLVIALTMVVEVATWFAISGWLLIHGYVFWLWLWVIFIGWLALAAVFVVIRLPIIGLVLLVDRILGTTRPSPDRWEELEIELEPEEIDLEIEHRGW